MVFLASISTLNCNTTMAVKGLNVKQFIGFKRGLNCRGVILSRRYKIERCKHRGLMTWG